MVFLISGLVLGLIVLVLSTDQFVRGAAAIAKDLAVSSVLIGAVILGCGTGLPELAMAFYGAHESPWRQILQLEGEQGEGLPMAGFFFALVLVLSLPTLFPDRVRRHSPLILLATILFAAMLRGTLDRIEGAAMILGFLVGCGWILNKDQNANYDPWRDNPANDDYGNRAYIEAPVMTPVQTGLTRVLFGLLGTAIGAQLIAFSALGLLRETSSDSEVLRNIIFVSLGSLLPHLVVALQALRQHNEGLAIGNLIGSSLFNSLVIGGLVAVVRPYQHDQSLGITTLGVVITTALLSWMLLSTESEMSRKQGIALVVVYAALIGSAVL